MNPETNKFEKLFEAATGKEALKQATENIDKLLNQVQSKLSSTGGLRKISMPSPLLRADGTHVPDHWTTFMLGEEVVIKHYRFKVAYIGETTLLFEPVGPELVEKQEED